MTDCTVTEMWSILVVSSLLLQLISVHLPASSREHLSYDDCLEDKKENYQNCSVLCCVQQLCTTICTYI